MKEKIKKFFQKFSNYIKELCKHPLDALLPTLIAEIVFWSPVWISAILAWTISPWWWTVATGVVAFWCAPLTPAVILQVGLIGVFISGWKRIKNKIKKERKDND